MSPDRPGHTHIPAVKRRRSGGARPPADKTSRSDNAANGGKLRIGDDWNAIRIIALSQSNPLKAIAEFVENSIDAHATTVTITRGREHGAHYLSIKDDGDGVPRDEAGLPNFKYVATHICDSIKRRLKTEGLGSGLQGEFGIGLLSFWTVGDTLTMASAGAAPPAHHRTMSKGYSRYRVTQLGVLFATRGPGLRLRPGGPRRVHHPPGECRCVSRSRAPGDEQRVGPAQPHGQGHQARNA